MATEENITQEAVQSVINLLETNVPKSDVTNIESELKKDFTLAKRRSKGPKKIDKNKKTRTLSRTDKTALSFIQIPRDSVKYNEVQELNRAWLEYISQLLELDKPIPDCTSKGWENFTQTLYRADFHGCILEVVRSKCPSYVGKKGICIMDTKDTFKIVSRDDVVTTVPKRESVFEMDLKNMKITLFGKHLCIRPAERSAKKIKTCHLPDL